MATDVADPGRSAHPEGGRSSASRKRQDWRRLDLLYPSVLASALVLSVYADTPVSLPQTYRTLAIAAGTTAAAQLILSLLFRSASAGALGAAVAVLFVAFGWFDHILLVPATAILLWEWLRLRFRRTAGHSLPSAATILHPFASVLAASFFAVAVGTGVNNGAIGLPRLAPAIAPVTAAVDGPDLFVILLDAYARADTLAELGYDNRRFLDGLEERGFQVASESRSNYSRTGLTLASMFNMRHITDVPALSSPPDGYNQQHRLISDTLHAGNPALDVLHRAGYESYYLPSRVAQYAVEPVGHMLAGAELDNFEIYLLGMTQLGPLIQTVAPAAIYDQQRARTLLSFETIRRLAVEESPRPRFLFAHLMAPHPPFVFTSDGSAVPVPECFPITCTILEPPVDPDLARSRYIDQLAYINQLVTEAVDTILASEPDAVIVLMSDHGSRLMFDDFVESTRNFMAIRADRVSVPATMTPISLFPMLFNAYLGTALDAATPSSFASLERTPWPMQEVP